MPSSEEPASMCLRSGERRLPGQRPPPASDMDTCKRGTRRPVVGGDLLRSSSVRVKWMMVNKDISIFHVKMSWPFG
ncbi:unnamed protein product [Linum trigynum]|uniref:Uncharacterized protein n=1 Tax=Linum trigynum TaxID=586398 RepID=A0AAV2E7C7_9ROSI